MAIRQPKKFKPTKARLVQANLHPILRSCRIEISQPGDEQPIYLQGPELLLEALRSYAYRSPKIVAKYLENFAILSSPVNGHLFPDLVDELGNWRMPTEDEICDYSGIDPSDFLAQCHAALHHYGLQQAELLVKVAAPEVVRAAVESAKEIGRNGAADRRMLLEAAEVIKPAGALVNIDQRSVTVNNNFPGQAEGLPAWPGLKKDDGTGESNAVGMLPAATVDNVVDGEIVQEQSPAYVSSPNNRG